MGLFVFLDEKLLERDVVVFLLGHDFRQVTHDDCKQQLHHVEVTNNNDETEVQVCEERDVAVGVIKHNLTPVFRGYRLEHHYHRGAEVLEGVDTELDLRVVVDSVVLQRYAVVNWGPAKQAIWAGIRTCPVWAANPRIDSAPRPISGIDRLLSKAAPVIGNAGKLLQAQDGE